MTTTACQRVFLLLIRDGIGHWKLSRGQAGQTVNCVSNWRFKCPEATRSYVLTTEIFLPKLPSAQSSEIDTTAASDADLIYAAPRKVTTGTSHFCFGFPPRPQHICVQSVDFVIVICRTDIGLYPDAIARDEVGPPNMVNEIDIRDYFDLRFGSLENRHAGTGIIIARWI